MIELKRSKNYEKNRKRAVADMDFCAVCGKAMENPQYQLHLFYGDTVVTENEAQAIITREGHGGDMLFFALGNDCLKQNPELKPYVTGYNTTPDAPPAAPAVMGIMATKKLTPTQARTWEEIKEDIDRAASHLSTKVFSVRSATGTIYSMTGTGVKSRTLQGIAAVGLIAFNENASHRRPEFKLTDKGLAELRAGLAALDAPPAPAAGVSATNTGAYSPVPYTLPNYSPEPDELTSLRQQLAEQIDHAAILAADRQRLLAALDRFKAMYDLMVGVDGQYAVQEILDNLRPDSTEGMIAYGEWLALMDSDFGVMAQYNQTGQYADEQPMTDVMMNGVED